MRDLSGEVQKFSGEVQNDLRGGAKRSQGRCAPAHTFPQNLAMVILRSDIRMKAVQSGVYASTVYIYKNVYVRKVVKYVASLKLVV